MVASVSNVNDIVRAETAFTKSNYVKTRWFYNPNQGFACDLDFVNQYEERIL
jgi:hypothetical protein